MIGRKLLFSVVSMISFGANLYAQAPTAALPLARYPDIKTRFNQSLSEALTNEERLYLFRETVNQGRYSGQIMSRNMFQDFKPGRFHLSPTTPGLSQTVLLLASDNPNVAKGNARTLRYANTLQGDSRFKVVGLNTPRTNTAGKTDADIIFRHESTGLQVRMEVKNMGPGSQRTNLVKIKGQILKMAQDAKNSGEMQVWANRWKVIPEVRAFAEQQGVRVEESLRTGNKNWRPGDRSFQDFANDLDKDLRAKARFAAVAGSVKAGMGIYLVYQAIFKLRDDVAAFSDAPGDWLRVGEHGSTLLAGGGFSTAGAAQLAKQIPVLANSPRLGSLTKWGGRLGLAGTVLAEGFLIGQYLSGSLTERQFWQGQAGLGGGLAGGFGGGFVGFKAGGLAGGAIGTFLAGPFGTAPGAAIGATVGTIIGAFGGGYAGAHFADSGMEGFYRFQDTKQHERYGQFLLRHYQSP